jgi:hypothetical protein
MPCTPVRWKTCSPATGQSPGAGLTANLYRRTATAKDVRRLARRFRIFEDLILRFATCRITGDLRHMPHHAADDW